MSNCQNSAACKFSLNYLLDKLVVLQVYISSGLVYKYYLALLEKRPTNTKKLFLSS